MRAGRTPPLLRATETAEIDTTAPSDQVADRLEELIAWSKAP